MSLFTIPKFKHNLCFKCLTFNYRFSCKSFSPERTGTIIWATILAHHSQSEATIRLRINRLGLGEVDCLVYKIEPELNSNRPINRSGPLSSTNKKFVWNKNASARAQNYKLVYNTNLLLTNGWHILFKILLI